MPVAPEPTKTEFVDPSWNEIFTEIGKQLHTRTGLLTKRVLFISIPALVVFFVVQLIVRLVQFKGIDDLFILLSAESFIWGTLAVIVVLFTTIILMSILKIEQAVWLDSHFDGRKLTPEESWRIAKKLYWASSYLQFKLFYRYYIWPIIFVLVGFIFGGYLIAKPDFLKFMAQLNGVLIFLYIFVLCVSSVLWARYLKIKLSYVPFLFLDRYHGQSVHSSQFWGEFFKEIWELNEISKEKSFKKNVMLELAADAAMSYVEYIAAHIQKGFEIASGKIPSVGGAVVGATGITITRAATEVAHRIILFAKMTGRYVLYRYALQNLHNKSHHINEYIYSLKDS
jgi:hypothetical protein